jgi:hypothetical protein
VTTTVAGGINGRPVVISGDYCVKLLLNGEVIWDIEDPIVTRPSAPVEDEALLRSDCRYMLDMNLFIQGKMEEADAAKLTLDGLQRREEVLRMGQSVQPPAAAAAAAGARPAAPTGPEAVKDGGAEEAPPPPQQSGSSSSSFLPASSAAIPSLRSSETFARNKKESSLKKAFM